MPSEEPYFAFDNCDVRALIDFVTFETPGKRDLPPLDGMHRWVVSEHHKKLTLHDPTVSDLIKLSHEFPAAPILELEVAVDFWPRPDPTRDREAVLDDCFQSVRRHLHPYGAPFLKDAKTAGYDPAVRKPIPINRRLPSSREQLLYGFRDDAPAQVKVYVKKIDQGRPLPPDEHRVRVEVNLKRPACESFGLHRLDDLRGCVPRRGVESD